MTNLPTDLDRLSGKAAVFVRGLIQYLDKQSPSIDMKLRPAQKAGMDAVEALGETISVPYVSKLTKLLETSGVVNKIRKGKGYVLNRDIQFEAVADYLEESFQWGTTIEREDSEDTIRIRSEFLDLMGQKKAVRITNESPLSKVAYQVAIDKFKSGKYDMVFVDRTIDLNVMDYGDYIGELRGTIHASVANG